MHVNTISLQYNRQPYKFEIDKIMNRGNQFYRNIRLHLNAVLYKCGSRGLREVRVRYENNDNLYLYLL